MQHSLVAAGGAILFLCCCLHTEQVTGCHVGAGRTPESCCHFNISTLIICKQKRLFPSKAAVLLPV